MCLVIGQQRYALLHSEQKVTCTSSVLYTIIVFQPEKCVEPVDWLWCAPPMNGSLCDCDGPAQAGGWTVYEQGKKSEYWTANEQRECKMPKDPVVFIFGKEMWTWYNLID